METCIREPVQRSEQRARIRRQIPDQLRSARPGAPFEEVPALQESHAERQALRVIRGRPFGRQQEQAALAIRPRKAPRELLVPRLPMERREGLEDSIEDVRG